MKILHTVEFYSPSTGGAQEVVRQLSERMAARGHRVTVATTALPERTSTTLNGVAIESFQIEGNAVRGFRGEVDRYKAFLRSSRFDVVMNYAAQQWTADLFFEVMGDVRARKVLVPCGYSGLYDPAYGDYFERLPAVLRGYDACVYLSDSYRDIAFARHHGLRNGHLIPNGAGLDEFGDASDEFRRAHGIEGLFVLTVGNHTGWKGHADAIRAVRRAGLPKVTLVIAGHGPGGCEGTCRRSAVFTNVLSRMTGTRVLVLDLPRADVVRAFHAADLFLFLSNLEASPIVLFEAAASGTPFIASPAGNAAEIAKWTGAGVIVGARTSADGLVHADVDEAARRIRELATDAPRRTAMATAGQARWRERFTWERITDRYLALYRSLLD